MSLAFRSLMTTMQTAFAEAERCDPEWFAKFDRLHYLDTAPLAVLEVLAQQAPTSYARGFLAGAASMRRWHRCHAGCARAPSG